MIETREDLVIYASELGCKISAEIGVQNGKFSAVICSHLNGLHICVDIWSPHSVHKSADRQERKYRHTIGRMQDYRTAICRMTSVEAATIIADNCLDFVYIDAMHDYTNVKNDIIAWYPKVRIGGIISGHDYVDGGGVKKAVDEFFGSVNLTTAMEPSQSWYIIKK